MLYLSDSHSHSKNSPDAKDSVNDMCAKAVSLGLTAYAITDHIECYTDRTDFEVPEGELGTLYTDIFENSMKDIYEAKEKYKGKIHILAGIELGEPCQDLERSDYYTSDKRLDFIIASMHQIRGKQDFYFLDYSKENIPELLQTYFEEIYETCKWNRFDVIGHLTYTLRYMQGEQGFKVDLKPYEEIIRECFKILAQNGKGIEVNTSGYRQKFGDFFPSFEYVKMFKECGGEIITTGSDSHRTEDVGKGILEATEMIKRAGFEYIAYFKERRPQFIKI